SVGTPGFHNNVVAEFGRLGESHSKPCKHPHAALFHQVCHRKLIGPAVSVGSLLQEAAPRGDGGAAGGVGIEEANAKGVAPDEGRGGRHERTTRPAGVCNAAVIREAGAVFTSTSMRSLRNIDASGSACGCSNRSDSKVQPEGAVVDG